MKPGRAGQVRFRQESVLDVAECDALIEAFTPRLVKSNLPGRSSSIARPLEDESLPFTQRLRERIENFTGLPAVHQEMFQGIRYFPGECFGAHWDWFPRGHPKLADGGQRLYTAMLYLNTPEAGGETKFPLLGKSIAPAPGLLAMWNLTDGRGNVLVESKHAGTAPVSGVKFALVTWVRERQLRD